MTEETKHGLGRALGLILVFILDGALAYYTYKTFHSVLAGLLVWLVLRRVSNIMDSLDEIKKRLN